MEKWLGKVAVVTGASAGIGEAIAIRLVEAGMKVAGLARRVEKVQELGKKLNGEKGQLYAVKCDVTKEDDILKAFKWIEQNLGTVQVLVNNAGVMSKTNLIDGDSNEWRRVIDTNVMGYCICTREAIKSMRSEGQEIPGHIIHINSISGHYVVCVPNINVYPATKHAVTALGKILRNEINALNSKIKITSVSPGYVQTEMLTANHVNLNTAMDNVYNNSPHLQCDDVADAVVYALSTKPNVMIEEITMRPIGEII